MQLKIRRLAVYTTLGFITFLLGTFFVVIFIESLNKYGIWGYILLALFLVMGYLYWRYEQWIKEELKIIDETVEKVASKYKDKFNPHEQEVNKLKLREHLINKNKEGDVFIISLPFLKKPKQETSATYPDIPDFVPDTVKQELIKRVKND